MIAALFFFFSHYCAVAIPQMVQFANASRWIFTGQSNGLNSPYDVAIDSSGNLYIADYGNNRVLKETLSNGTYTQTVVTTSQLSGPAGVAVDSSGNVYIADSANNRVLKEAPTGGSYSETTIGSGMATPFGVAVDGYGNLYVADSDNGRILLETPSGETYTQSALVTDLFQPFGVAVDATGNLYIAGRGMNQVLKETPSDGGYLQSVITSNVVAPYKVIVDAVGNVYVADSYDHRILKETWNSGSGVYVETTLLNDGQPMGLALDASGNLYVADYGFDAVAKVQSSPPDFGSIAVGAQPTLVTLTFVFNGAGIIGNPPSVVTMGATGEDFQDAATGTCTTNGSSHSYSPSDLCSVDVNFAPMFAGGRYGAVELQDAGGNPLASTYVTGTGLAPRLALVPGVQTTVASDTSAGLSNPVGVALDGNSNLYVADWGNSRIIMLPWSDGAYGTAVPIGSTLDAPTGVAVDGAGNVYIAGYDGGTVLKETLAAGNYAQTVIGSGTSLPAGVAVDGAGNVYIADYGTNVALLETFASGVYTQSVISSDLSSPYGIAFDGAGNVYLADSGNNRLVKETLSSGTYSESTILSGLSAPQGVALDGAGDVYFTDTGNNSVAILPWNGSSYGTPLNFGTALQSPQALAFDASGNLYIGDSWNNRVVKEDFSQTPPLDFGTVTVGQTSQTQTVVVANPGTAPLAFTSISVASGFSLQTDCSVDAPLAPGAMCSLHVSFAPSASGPLTGIVELDSTAAPGVTTISLNGVGQTAATQLGFAANIPNPVANGGNLGAVAVEVLDSSGNPVTGSSAAVALQVTGPSGFTTYNTSVNAVAGVASFDLSALALTIAGNYTITASSPDLTSAQGSFVVSPVAAFSLSLASNTLTVASGASGTMNLTISPTGGFTGDISLSCTNLPAYSSCSFNPASVHADGSNGSLSSVLTVSTKADSIAVSMRSKRPLMFACWSGSGLLGLFLFPAVRRRGKGRRLIIASAMLVLGLVIILPGCGSNSHSTPAQQTPPGTYSVTLNATSGGTTHSSVLTLTVN
jgi:sugar lactone lactonase YvrE